MGLLALASGLAARGTDPATNTSAASPPARHDPARVLIEQALAKLQHDDIDGATPILDRAIQLNPSSTVAYVLLGSIEASKRHWPDAEAYFTKALQTAPNDNRIKFMLADAKFSAGDYDAARAFYVSLESDATNADLAIYDVYLCDLFAGHEALAARELGMFSEGNSPAFYFAHGAWGLYHHDLKDGKASMDQAVKLFSMQQNGEFAQQLRNSGYLPLPGVK